MARAGKEALAKEALADEAWALVIALMADRRDVAFEIAGSYGLTPGDMKSLMTLNEDVAPTMGALAEIWSCDASNVTWLVDRLEQRGLVERRPSPTDRRVKAVALTERGRQARSEIRTAFTKAPSRLRDLSRDDLETLRAVLRRTGLDPQGVPDVAQVIGRRHRPAGLASVPPGLCAT
jgi:DNA-binding MarR family transcriptional regulator